MTLTIKEFRNDPERVAKLRRALENPALREAMQILATRGPGIVSPNITDTYASVMLGHAAGWNEYHVTLEAMAIHPQEPDIDNERLKLEEE